MQSLKEYQLVSLNVNTREHTLSVKNIHSNTLNVSIIDRNSGEELFLFPLSVDDSLDLEYEECQKNHKERPISIKVVEKNSGLPLREPFELEQESIPLILPRKRSREAPTFLR